LLLRVQLLVNCNRIFVGCSNSMLPFEMRIVQ
jgi:hypothetical protein